MSIISFIKGRLGCLFDKLEETLDETVSLRADVSQLRDRVHTVSDYHSFVQPLRDSIGALIMENQYLLKQMENLTAENKVLAANQKRARRIS